MPVQQTGMKLTVWSFSFSPLFLPKLCIDLFAHVNSKRPLCHTILGACLFAGVAFGA